MTSSYEMKLPYIPIKMGLYWYFNILASLCCMLEKPFKLIKLECNKLLIILTKPVTSMWFENSRKLMRSTFYSACKFVI